MPERAMLPRRTNLRVLVHRPGVFVRVYWAGLIVLLVGATADVVTTFINVRAYGLDVEAHLVQRWVSHVVGITAGVPLAKVLQLGFVLLVASWWRPWCGWVLGVCGVMYLLAAISNHFLLL